MPFEPESLPHQVVIPSDLHAARTVEEQIIRKTEELGYSPECAFAIRLALEEAVVNAHKHGNRGDPAKQLHLSYDVRRERTVVRVRDEGDGFDPGAVPDPTDPDRLSLPNGRGIMLMRAYLDDVRFSERGNEVQLVKENC
jgi:serine/threonine-protein kinase RsbW